MWLTNSNGENIVTVPSWKENIVDPLQEEDAVDIPEVRIIKSCPISTSIFRHLSDTYPKWFKKVRNVTVTRFILQNLDDSVYLKRHAKLELDEKRRKRWEFRVGNFIYIPNLGLHLKLQHFSKLLILLLLHFMPIVNFTNNFVGNFSGGLFNM